MTLFTLCSMFILSGKKSFVIFILQAILNIILSGPQLLDFCLSIFGSSFFQIFVLCPILYIAFLFTTKYYIRHNLTNAKFWSCVSLITFCFASYWSIYVFGHPTKEVKVPIKFKVTEEYTEEQTEKKPYYYFWTIDVIKKVVKTREVTKTRWEDAEKLELSNVILLVMTNLIFMYITWLFIRKNGGDYML